MLSFTQAHLCDTPFCNMSRDNCAIPPTQTRTKEFCDTIATRIARYGKYHCWASNQKSLGVHTILVRKIWFYPTPPPPKRAQNEEKLYKLLEKSSKLTLFRGGGGNAILWTKRFYGHLGVSDLRLFNFHSLFFATKIWSHDGHADFLFLVCWPFFSGHLALRHRWPSTGVEKAP